MPPKLFKLFSDINRTNNNIINQVKSMRNGKNIKIVYPAGLRPTRRSVLDKRTLGVYSGGVNYFPFEPDNVDIDILDRMLEPFNESEVYTVSLKMMLSILDNIESGNNDWDPKTFIGFINTFISDNPLAQGKLIVRRNRDIAKGTGTMLSPNDRKLGDSFPNDLVLTLYKVTGNKGWNGREIWVPNIKLPGDSLYYGSDL